MAKNIVVISSTLRKNGNSELLAKEFLKGAQEVGNNVEFVTLQDKEIKFCKGCLAFYSGWPKAWATFNLANAVWNEN